MDNDDQRAANDPSGLHRLEEIWVHLNPSERQLGELVVDDLHSGSLDVGDWPAYVASLFSDMGALRSGERTARDLRDEALDSIRRA